MSDKTPVAYRGEMIETADFQRPHVVILGAGASKAAFPNGDRNGRHVPVMADLVDVVNLKPLLSRAAVVYSNENFEQLYGSLHGDPQKADLLRQLESSVHEYFSSLELPDTPTIYDHLLLSLRRKDAIFTFNWDPFLFDAYVRNRRFALPEIFFLHGNVRVGHCSLHPSQWGALCVACPQCRSPFEPSKLLYPIAQKNYSKNEFIRSHWENVNYFLSNAFVLTIFGYSSPASDAEAVDAMRAAWEARNQRLIERVEVIDICPRAKLQETWSNFIHYDHADFRRCFYDSWVARYPRRSCEVLREITTQGRPVDFSPFPSALGFTDLYQWLMPFAEQENANTAQ